MVPNGWVITNFGQLVEFRNGLNFTKADQGETIKIVGVADFKDHSSLNSLDNLSIINVSNTVKDNDLIKSGDVLYVRSNGNKNLIGRCLFFPEVTEKLSFSGFTIRGRITSKSILPHYLALLSRSEIVTQQFSKNGGGTNISNLSQQILNDVLIPLPTVDEQRKIAQILSTWDRGIATTEKLINTSKQQKKALMQQLLTDKKRLVDPETGKAFEGEWEDKVFSNFFDIGSSKRILQSEWKESGIPFFRTRELVSLANRKPFSSEIFISKELYSAITDKYGKPKSGDFLVSGVGTLGISYLVKESDEFYFKDGNVLWFKSLGNIDSKFFKYCFESDLVQNQIINQTTITTVGTYTITNAKQTKFLCPPNHREQQKIASVLSIADKEIELLEAKLAHFKQEKKALMQQLLTGKRRVSLSS